MTGYSGPNHSYRPHRRYTYCFSLVKSIREKGEKPRQIHITSLGSFWTGNYKTEKIPANGFLVWENIKLKLLKAKETGRIFTRDGWVYIDITDKEIEKLKQSVKDKFLYWDELGEWWDIVPE